MWKLLPWPRRLFNHSHPCLFFKICEVFITCFSRNLIHCFYNFSSHTTCEFGLFLACSSLETLVISLIFFSSFHPHSPTIPPRSFSNALRIMSHHFGHWISYDISKLFLVSFSFPFIQFSFPSSFKHVPFLIFVAAPRDILLIFLFITPKMLCKTIYFGPRD